MINDNFLYFGEQFYLKNINYKNVYLNFDGKLIDDNGEVYDIYLKVVLLLNKKVFRVNGFDYWNVMCDNRIVLIDEIRNLYREYLLKKLIKE